MKKKNILILSGVGVLIVGLIVFKLFSPATNDANNLADQNNGVDDGIEYFEVPDIEQVYINGVIQPEQTESFAKDAKMISTPEIKVANGEVVEPETELFSYEDKEVTNEIENQQNILNRLQTKRQNLFNKWNRAIDNYNNTPADERATNGSEINEQNQAELESIDEEIAYTNETMNDLQAKQFIITKAKFKGRVSIPEVKDDKEPILRLTSDELYFSGKVNEKDLEKIAIGQSANLSVVSGDISTTGKITYIDENPPEPTTEAGTEANNLSNYTLKISLDDLSVVKNGYHMQATIDLKENDPIAIPKAAVHEEDGTTYVLVNDFGSVLRREVKTGETKGDEVIITEGLESADRIIVSSKKELKPGDLIDEMAPIVESEPTDRG